MFLRTDKVSNVDKYLNLYYSKYHDKIHKLIDTIISNENIYNVSDKQYILNQFFYVFSLITLLYIEYKRGFIVDWNYYIQKYNLLNLSKKIACNGMELNKILNIFELPNIEPNLNNTAIEGNYIVEGIIPKVIISDVILFDIRFNELVDVCVLNIEDTCKC